MNAQLNAVSPEDNNSVSIGFCSLYTTFLAQIEKLCNYTVQPVTEPVEVLMRALCLHLLVKELF